MPWSFFSPAGRIAVAASHSPAAQHEVEHGVEAPPLRVEYLERPSLHNLPLDWGTIFLPNAEVAGRR